MAGKIVEVTDSSFDTVVKNGGVVLVDFWAPWCGPCRRLNPVIEELSKEMEGKVTFVKLNTDENISTSARFGSPMCAASVAHASGVLSSRLERPAS